MLRPRGQALARLNEVSGARAALVRAVEREDSEQNLLALGHFELEQNDLVRATAYFERAIEKAPTSPHSLLSRAVARWLSGVPDKARADLEAACRRDRRIARPDDLKFDHFWGPRTLAALEALSAPTDSPAA